MKQILTSCKERYRPCRNNTLNGQCTYSIHWHINHVTLTVYFTKRVHLWCTCACIIVSQKKILYITCKYICTKSRISSILASYSRLTNVNQLYIIICYGSQGEWHVLELLNPVCRLRVHSVNLPELCTKTHDMSVIIIRLVMLVCFDLSMICNSWVWGFIPLPHQQQTTLIAPWD